MTKVSNEEQFLDIDFNGKHYQVDKIKLVEILKRLSNNNISINTNNNKKLLQLIKEFKLEDEVFLGKVNEL